MKKICVLVSVFLCFLLAAPAIAADPFDVHEAGFGPRIKGLQLGMPMTLTEMVAAGLEVWPGDTFNLYIHDIGQKGNLGLQFTKDGNQLKGWEINDILTFDRAAQREFSKYETLEELFEAVSKEGFSGVSCNGGSFYFYINSKSRVNRITLFNRVFNAQDMSHREFAQALLNAYNLPSLEGGRNVYTGKNLNEGWQVEIYEDRIRVFPITIPGAGSFN